MKQQDYRGEMDRILFSETLEEDIIERLREYRRQQLSAPDPAEYSAGAGMGRTGQSSRKRAGLYHMGRAAVLFVIVLAAGVVFAQTGVGKAMIGQVHRQMADIMEGMFRDYAKNSAGDVQYIGRKEAAGDLEVEILEVGLTGEQMVLRVRAAADGGQKLDTMELFSSLSGEGLSDWGDYTAWGRKKLDAYQCLENEKTGEYILMKPLEKGVSGGDLLGRELTYRAKLRSLTSSQTDASDGLYVYDGYGEEHEITFQVTFSRQLQESIVSVNESFSLDDGTTMLVRECGYNGIYAWLTYETPHTLTKCMDEIGKRMDRFLEEHPGQSISEEDSAEIFEGAYYYWPVVFDKKGRPVGETWKVQQEKRASGSVQKDLFALDTDSGELVIKPVKVNMTGNGQAEKTELDVEGIPVELDRK